MRTSTVHQTGLTLVEILVALAISMLLLAGVTQLFVSSKQTYRANDALSQIQESGRFALDMLARDIRMAGATGCEETEEIANVLRDPDTRWWSSLADGPLIGFDAGVNSYGSVSAAFTTGNATGNRVPADGDGNGPDALIVLKSSGAEDYTIASHHPSSAQFKLSGKHNIQDGDILTVCDTENTAIFQVTNATPEDEDNPNKGNVTIVHNNGTGTPGNCSKGLGYPTECTANGNPYQYGPDAVMVRYDPTAYYIGWSSAGNGRRSLYRIGLTGAAVELVQDVDDMQVLYGLDTNNDNAVDSYATATAVQAANNWRSVRSVRISLLIRSRDNNVTTATQAINYDANGDGTAEALTLDAADRRLRQVFTTTIGIRNRLP